MIEIGDKVFIFSLEGLEKAMVIDENYRDNEYVETTTRKRINEVGDVFETEIRTKSIPKMKEYDSTKYDYIRTLFEVLLTSNEEFDMVLGFENAMTNASLPFKLSFNTLINYGILKEI